MIPPSCRSSIISWMAAIASLRYFLLIRFSPPQNGQARASDDNFDFTRGQRRRHSEFRPDRQAFPDRIRDIRFRLCLRMPLAHAAWNRWALCNVHAFLVLVDAD